MYLLNSWRRPVNLMQWLSSQQERDGLTFGLDLCVIRVGGTVQSATGDSPVSSYRRSAVEAQRHGFKLFPLPQGLHQTRPRDRLGNDVLAWLGRVSAPVIRNHDISTIAATV